MRPAADLRFLESRYARTGRGLGTGPRRAAPAAVSVCHAVPPCAASVAAVFFAGGDAAPNVPLGLVDVQHFLDLQVQRTVEQGEPFGYILMFRCDELERFRPSPNPQANAGKYPHSHLYPLRFSG